MRNRFGLPKKTKKQKLLNAIDIAKGIFETLFMGALTAALCICVVYLYVLIGKL